jgi:outer membrane protein assembly factor BamB
VARWYSRLPLRRVLSAATIALAAACGGRPVLVPDVFPVETAWTASLGEAIEGPLATDGKRLFVATRDGVVRGLDLATGAAVWEVKDRTGVVGAAAGLVAVRAPDGIVWGMDPETGRTRWRAETAVAGAIPPVVSGDAALVAGEGLTWLDPATGAPRWSVPAPPAVKGVPLAWGAHVLAGEADGALRARDSATGALVWAFPTAGLVAAPVVDDDGRVLVGTTDRRFLALRAKDGKQDWRWKVGADVQAAAVILDDKVLFATHENVLFALKRGSGKMAWRAGLPSRPLGGPVLLGQAVLVACFENDVLGFDGRTGRRLGSLRTSAEIRTPPLLVNRRLYIGLRDHTVVALQLAGTPPAGSAEPQASPVWSPSPPPPSPPPVP